MLASIASAIDLPARLIGQGYRAVETDEVYATVIDAADPVVASVGPAGAAKLPDAGPGKTG